MSAGEDQTGGWLDARGCLTPAALTILRQAAPGRAPEAIARHLVDCRRCQERLLAGSAGPVRRRETASLPARSRRLWWGSGLALAALLLLTLFALALAGLTRP